MYRDSVLVEVVFVHYLYIAEKGKCHKRASGERSWLANAGA